MASRWFGSGSPRTRASTPSAPTTPNGGSGVRVAILAGGASSRMGGRPKGLLEVGGERILDRLIRIAREAFGRDPILVSNAPDAASWRPDLRPVPDLRPASGPL